MSDGKNSKKPEIKDLDASTWPYIGGPDFRLDHIKRKPD
jgi:hypothetical protein